MFTPPKFNIAPEKWGLEDDPFLLGFGKFSGAFAVKLREGNLSKIHVQVNKSHQKCHRGQVMTQPFVYRSLFHLDFGLRFHSPSHKRGKQHHLMRWNSSVATSLRIKCEDSNRKDNGALSWFTREESEHQAAKQISLSNNPFFREGIHSHIKIWHGS